MKITLPYLIVLLVRGEGSKIPLTVHEHEVDILREMHGGDEAIIVTDHAPPVLSAEIETADEYARLQQYYRGDNENPNPTQRIFRNLDEFEAAFTRMQPDQPIDQPIDQPKKKA